MLYMNERSSTLRMFFICPSVREHLGGPGSLALVYGTAVGASTEKLESAYNFYEHRHGSRISAL